MLVILGTAMIIIAALQLPGALVTGEALHVGLFLAAVFVGATCLVWA